MTSDSPSAEEMGSSNVKVINLSSNDELFAEIRDKNFNAVGPTLSRKAKAISAQFEERHEAQTVQQLRSFVDRMPQMKVINTWIKLLNY